MPQRQRLRRFGQIVILTSGLSILIAISAASIVALKSAERDAETATHTIEVENQLYLSQLQMRRAEAAERGFLITGNKDFLNDFKQSYAEIVPAFERLRQLTADNPIQQKNLQAMIPLVEARFREADQAVTLRESGKMAEAFDLVQAGSGRAIMIQVRDIGAAMRAEEDRLYKLRTQSADSSRAFVVILVTTGSALILILTALSIWLVRQASHARDKAEQALIDTNVNLDLRSPLVNIMGFTSELEELRAGIFDRIATLRDGMVQNAAAPGVPATIGEIATPSQDSDALLAEEFDEALAFIKSSIGKMDRLISAILQLTREGRRELHPTFVDMRELIEGVVSTVAHQAAEANAEIRIEAMPNVTSDRLAMEQIFSNLIDNALKYLKPGVPGKITVKGKNKLRFAIFEVTDNGRGIDPRDHQRIFDLFRRAGAQDKPGQGIGLAHVRALVRRMGGQLSVTSELGRGSTFTVMLPMEWVEAKKDGDV